MSEDVKTSIGQEVDTLVEWIMTCQSCVFFTFEVQLIPKQELGLDIYNFIFICVQATSRWRTLDDDRLAW